MKVVCIDDTKWKKDAACPSFMEVCTVSDSCISPFSAEPVYSFLEYPPIFPHTFRLFSQKYFAPISESDETGMVTEKEEVYA